MLDSWNYVINDTILATKLKTLHSTETLDPVNLEPFIAETRDSFEELYEGFAMAESTEKD